MCRLLRQNANATTSKPQLQGYVPGQEGLFLQTLHRTAKVLHTTRQSNKRCTTIHRGESRPFCHLRLLACNANRLGDHCCASPRCRGKLSPRNNSNFVSCCRDVNCHRPTAVMSQLALRHSSPLSCATAPAQASSSCVVSDVRPDS